MAYVEMPEMPRPDDPSVSAAVQAMERALKKSAATMDEQEARYLVDAYYQMQEDRIRNDGRIRAVLESGEPHDIFRYLSDSTQLLERQVRGALDVYSNSSELGQWARSITGVGPVIAAGLLAHIDVTIHPTCGYIWRFAGLDPSVSWGKGEKRPWNAKLKVLCWKLGESFVKVKGRDSGFYGHVYESRRAYEEARNESGDNATVAASTLKSKKLGKETESYKAYTEGRLPKGQIHARSKRYAVKLFLSHYHWVGYEIATGNPPAKPYAISILGHADLIRPPNWEGKAKAS